MAKLNDLIVTIGATTRDFDKALGKSMRKMKSFGKNTKALGKSLSRNLTLPLAGLAAMAVKTAASFEFSMAKVAAVSGFTANEMKVLEEQAKKLGGSTSKSASDVAGLQLELAKLGNTSSEIEAMTEQVLSLSVAFDTDLSQTAEIVGATLNQFGMDASETGRVVDNMATLFGSSALDLEGFGSAMSVIGPTANALGISLEDTGSALGILANAGLDASTSGTSLTKAFTTLVKNGTPANEVLDKLTSGNLSVAEGFEIFGDRAGKIIPLLQGTTAELADLTKKQQENTGAAVKARKILEDTAQGGFDELRSAVEAAGITLGQVLMPAVKKITQFVTQLASGLSSMSSDMSTTVVVIAAMAAALGPLLMILPSLVSGFMTLMSPIGLVVMAIVGLGIAIVTFADEIAPYITTVINYFITLYNESSLLRGIIGGIMGTVKVVFGFFAFAIDAVIEGFKDLGSVISALIAGDFSAIPDIISEAFANSDKRIIEFAAQAAQDFRASVEDELGREPIELITDDTVANALKTLGGLTDLIPSMSGGGSGGGGGAGSAKPANLQSMGARSGAAAQPQLIMEASTAVSDLAENMESARKEFSMMIDMGPAITGAFMGIGLAIGGLVAGTMTMADIFSQAIVGLANLLIDLGAQFIAAGIAASAFFVSLTTNPLAAVAAGVALVAAGAAIKGLHGKLSSSPPALAQGGLAYGPTLATVGDNKNASVDPEVIAPLSKLRGMMGGQNVVVTGKISGRDILITSDRNSIDRNRVRGY